MEARNRRSSPVPDPSNPSAPARPQKKGHAPKTYFDATSPSLSLACLVFAQPLPLTHPTPPRNLKSPPHTQPKHAIEGRESKTTGRTTRTRTRLHNYWLQLYLGIGY